MRTYEYSDALRDDFGGMHIRRRRIDAQFPFARTSTAWRIISGAVYYGLAAPLGFLVDKVWFGVRFENRKALRTLSDGCFLYGNHTQFFSDAVSPGLLAFPKRNYIVAGAETASIRGIGTLVQMLGALILPTELSAMRAFRAAMALRCAQKSVITIYPEAHIWPYYTKIRPFSSSSFAYPVQFDKPVVAMVTTTRKRLLPFLPPALTVTLSDPMYRDPALSDRAARDDLRARTYAFMCRVAAEKNQVEYVRYVFKQSAGEPSES